MKKIWFVINKYPNPVEPNVCVFIQQLVWSVADLGYDCSVIVPMPLNFNKKYKDFPEETFETNENGKKIKLYYPKYYSLGQSGKLAQKLRVKITTDLFTRAAEKVLKKEAVKPDILYSHFLCPAGVAVARLGKKYGIPSFLAHGEARYRGNEQYGNEKLAKELEPLKGLIAVSGQNRDFCVDSGIVKAEIAEVFPNGYRAERFMPRDKKEAREKFGFDQDAFLVGCCGSFDERKGVLRLNEAVTGLDGVQAAFAGKGKLVPEGPNCVWNKPINNQDLSWFYSALDVFCLPTRNEGCCNAIVEAIACGCPIVSSDRSFNHDICNETNSILIDPDDVAAIRSAIKTLKEDPDLLKRLRQGSLKMAEGLTLSARAERIMKFIEEKSK